jgi:hypothetical protein
MPPDYCKAALKRKDDIVSRKIAGETILVPVAGKAASLQRIFALNEVGEFIWTRLDGIRTTDQIAAELSDSYDVSLEQALSEACEFIEELLGAELVEEVR